MIFQNDHLQKNVLKEVHYSIAYCTIVHPLFVERLCKK
jgi:hypothetical protein